MGFGIGILIIGANLYGGVYKLINFIRGKLEVILRIFIGFFLAKTTKKLAKTSKHFKSITKTNKKKLAKTNKSVAKRSKN